MRLADRVQLVDPDWPSISRRFGAGIQAEIRSSETEKLPFCGASSPSDVRPTSVFDVDGRATCLFHILTTARDALATIHRMPMVQPPCR